MRVRTGRIAVVALVLACLVVVVVVVLGGVEAAVSGEDGAKAGAETASTPAKKPTRGKQVINGSVRSPPPLGVLEGN